MIYNRPLEDDYLKFNFFKRCGGGIGMTRLIRSMKMEGLI